MVHGVMTSARFNPLRVRRLERRHVPLWRPPDTIRTIHDVLLPSSGYSKPIALNPTPKS